MVEGDNMKSIITKISDEKCHISLSNKCFDKNAIYAAVYKMTDLYDVEIQPINEDEFGVTFTIKNQKDDPLFEEKMREFCNDVLDHQLRIDLDKQYGKIRELIVKHAFSPIENLKDVISKEHE
jgi:His-Xaa-Ser system protein HxsD